MLQVPNAMYSKGRVSRGRGSRRLMWLCLTFWMLLVGCGGDEPSQSTTPAESAGGEGSEEAGAARALGTPALPPPSPLRQRIQTELPTALTQLMISQAWSGQIPLALSEANPYRLPAYRRELLPPLYAERDNLPVFASPLGGLHERARPLLQELRAAYQHALDPSPYRLRELDRLEPILATQEPVSTVWALDGAALSVLTERAEVLVAPSMEELARLAVGLDGDALVADVADDFEERTEALRALVPSAIELDLLSVHAFLSYAFDMRHFNTNRMTLDEMAEQGGQREVQRERLRESFRAAGRATGDEMVAQLEALLPAHNQYLRLMSARARYAEIAASGGWPRLRARSLELGDNHPRVGELKQRLAVEGFFEGPIDNHFGQALADAVTSYQESHQMRVTGATHDMFWRSVNIPVERRLAQIELTMQRWRETLMRGEEYFVFVNIPDFHAEVWRDGERLTRFRIVVGNTDRECNPTTGTMDLVNATPIQHAEVEYLVFNPYWNVPPRIRRDELDLELLENPAWLHENGYEVVVTESGPRIRQLPGPDNALGMVKFIFPNIHNTYMHDTPHRRYFDFPIRNYSHGCMRVQDPMSYAEVLLTQDGQWDPDRIERILDSEAETTIHLGQHVPIFIEYYVVRVDDQGRANFLADVYRYDRERLEESEPTACAVPAPAADVLPEPAVVWNEDGTAVTPDGTVIRPDGEIIYSEAHLARLEGQTDGMVPVENAPVDRRVLRRDVDPEQDDGGEPIPGDIGP